MAGVVWYCSGKDAPEKPEECKKCPNVTSMGFCGLAIIPLNDAINRCLTCEYMYGGGSCRRVQFKDYHGTAKHVPINQIVECGIRPL